jgi:DNA-binding response OmpR family regulator
MVSRRATRVLVVEDDPDIASAVALELEHADYEARIERDAPGALLATAEWSPDLVVLDLGLPSMDGLDVCRRLRGASAIPIVVLTARGEVKDRIVGLDAGADDYVTKPFSLEELMARVRSALRRARLRDEGHRLELAGFVLDARARTVSYAGGPIDLTPREFDLLELLMRSSTYTTPHWSSSRSRRDTSSRSPGRTGRSSRGPRPGILAARSRFPPASSGPA